MAGNTEVRHPQATVENILGLSSPAQLKISIPVNGDITVDYSAFSGVEAAEGANQMLSADVAQLMGESQDLTFSSRSSADATVTVNDGAGGSITVRGFTTGPSFSLMRGDARPSIRVASAASALEHLKLDIYTPRLGSEEGGEGSATEYNGPADKVEDGNLASRLETLTKRMISIWEANRDLEEDDTSSAILTNRHELNTSNVEGAGSPLSIWYAMLKNSVQNLNHPWLRKLSENPSYNQTFNEAIVTTLRSRAPGFSHTLAQLAQDFQIMSVPGKDGGPGEFKMIRDRVLGEEKTLQMSTASFNANAAQPQGLFPVKQVIMRDSLGVAHMPNKKEGGPSINNSQGQILSAWPRSANTAAGDLLTISPTFYMTHVLQMAAPTESDGDKAEDYNRYASTLATLSEKAVRYQDRVIAKMTEDFCRSVYVDRALRATQATITVPMDLSVWPGDRYKMVDGNGSALFSGFLSRVDHTLARSRGGGEASTRLSFTHIQFGGFQLPDA